MKPWLLKTLIIVAALPVSAYPAMIAASASAGSETSGYVWLYPIYVVAASVCEWMCMRRRPEVTWILIVLVLLTHGAMWMLVLNPPL